MWSSHSGADEYWCHVDGKLLETSWSSVVLPPSGPVRLADFEDGGTEHRPLQWEAGVSISKLWKSTKIFHVPWFVVCEIIKFIIWDAKLCSSVVGIIIWQEAVVSILRSCTTKMEIWYISTKLPSFTSLKTVILMVFGMRTSHHNL